MAKIKVLRIIARLNIGGPAIHTILLSSGLDKERFASILVTGTPEKSEGDMFYFAQAHNVRPIVIRQFGRKINLINDCIAFWKIFLLIRKERPDIIHTHTAKAGALGRLAAALYNLFRRKEEKCKIIHTFHGTVLQGYFGKIASSFFIFIERTLARRICRIISVSEAIKKELLSLRIADAQKICVIPLGLELAGLLALSENKPDALLRVGIVARLVPIKNHRLFLSAAGIFLKQNPLRKDSCRFMIIGDGELREDLEQYSRELKINGFVEFSGWNRDTSKIYQDLDIVVLTSSNEGTPLSLIEAMAAARPVIATAVGGVRDLFIKKSAYSIAERQNLEIFENGILCPADDAQALAEALKLLADDRKLRAKMGEAGRIFVKERFSKERLISDIELLYNICLKRSSG